MKHKRVLVIGLGRFGHSLVEELWDTQVETVVIDKSAAAVELAKERASAAFVGDGSDPRVLEGIGAQEMDVAVVTHGEDFEASVLAVSALAQLKVPYIVVRAGNERQSAVLRAVGATRVVLVEDEMGRRLAAEVLSPASSDVLEYASSFRVVPWTPGPAIHGKTLVELDLQKRHEIHVLGYFRDRGAAPSRKPRLQVAHADYRVESGDTLLVIGLHQAVENFLTEVD